MIRKILLACGVLSSILYAAMLVLVPLGWPGYSSAAQTVSELSAIGAPTRALWVGPAVLYTLLMVAFGLGVILAAGRDAGGLGERRRRRLRAAGGVVVAYGILGLFWPPMHLRGTGFTATDVLHIAWTAATLLLMLLAIGFAAAALGWRFRLYSAATLAVFLVFGALTGVDAPRVAANLPTPWIGVWERVNIAAFLLWLAVLAIALLRRRPAVAPADGARRAADGAARAAPHIHGTVAPGFEEVRAEFERNFAERGDIGAAVAAYWRGLRVVDLWGGWRTPERDAPWEEDTMVVVMSTTKGLAAMTLAVANARGWLDYDAPVARYWPEFAANGKGAITVRQLLGHEAGLVLLDEKLTIARLRDLDDIARLLARQTPAWPPGTRHGYHAMTLGLYMQELIRHVDPAHRTLGRFFHEEIAGPLGIDFYIGLPPEIPDRRLAKFQPLSRGRALRALGHSTPALLRRVLVPRSLLRRSLSIAADLDFNDRRSLEVELPAGNGVGTARAIARAYSALAEGGAEIGLTPATLALLTAPPDATRPLDEVLGLPSYFSLGFLRPGPEPWHGSSPRALGAPGAGGSFGFADPDARVGYAYVMNKLDFWLVDDPREKALRDALYRSIERQEARPARAASASVPTGGRPAPVGTGPAAPIGVGPATAGVTRTASAPAPQPSGAPPRGSAGERGSPASG